MNPGTFVYAPEGFMQLEKNVQYCFLSTSYKLDRALLLQFTGDHYRQSRESDSGAGYAPPQVFLKPLPGRVFEEAIISGTIKQSPVQPTLPPWLRDLEGINFNQVDMRRKGVKKTHLQRVLEREAVILPLVEMWPVLLNEDNIIRKVNQFARSCQPVQNEARVRLWLFSYLAFGRNIWALLPPFHRSGTWLRENIHTEHKLGRPSIRGKYFGHNAVPLVEQIIESYKKRAKLGKPQTEIYAEAMVKDFGCTIEKGKGGFKGYYHSKGLPYPTLAQYFYHVNKKLGAVNVQKAKYGAQRVRSNSSADIGRFSESSANLMEGIEVDGYYLSELPKGIVVNEYMPPMCVVRGVCRTTGSVVGVGFSFGAETESAYRMMLFSMAISKDKFGELFGVKISTIDWPARGVPLSLTLDRGPGATLKVSDEVKKLMSSFGITPSWSGQSKATSESSHPRETKIQGSPSYTQSGLNHIELAKREITRVKADNESSDCANRLTLEMQATRVRPSPNGMWEFLSERGRSDAYNISFSDAIRMFLIPKEFTLHKSGVKFHDIMFDSPALRQTEVLDKVARTQTVKVQGYVLDFCLRYAWLEIDGLLVEVMAKLPIWDSNDQLYLSFSELEVIEEIKRETRSLFKEHASATKAESLISFKHATGKDWYAGSKKMGHAPSRKKRKGKDAVTVGKYFRGDRND